MSTTPSKRSEWKPTACILCECNCGLEVQLGGEGAEAGRRLVRFRGDKVHPASKGYACEKPHRLDHYQNGPDRLTAPLIRQADGTFAEASWDEAIAHVADRLGAIRDAHGGESIFYYGGGGQGNHLPGAYATATRRALGMRYRSSALAQEKTGEFWVGHRMMGLSTRADFEHCEVGLFLGKNPWFSHGIPRARVTLKELSADPERTLIVVDPRRTKSAELADVHLQVKPGTDAWLLAGLIAVLFEEDLLDTAFLAGADGLDEVRAVLGGVDVPGYASHCGVPEAQLREVARIIGQAKSFASFEDLGVQMNQHSTLVSYLHKLVWLLTGNYGRPGAHFSAPSLVNIADGRSKHSSQVTGARIVGGMIPCNSIADEILTDDPKRFRAMFVEAANPAHSLADGPRMREALGKLDFVVVVDVAMSETAQLADVVLPASTQFEKAEATFFNFEFPENVFHLRPRLMTPPAGALPEAEIHARLCEALGALEGAPMDELREAAAKGMAAYMPAFAKVAFGPQAKMAPVILYRTLGPALPEDVREGAVLLGLAVQAAMKNPKALASAGFDGPAPVAGAKLFEAMLSSPHGLVFAKGDWADVRGTVKTPSQRIELALTDLLEEAAGLAAGPPARDESFPFVLSAGERRSFTANTIIRDPDWRKKDAEGALRVHPEDAAALGVATGDRVKVTTPRGAATVAVEVSGAMQRGHISLPNGTGIGATGLHGGISPNELTQTESRDPFVGTPWHKRVPAKLERVAL
ncbi:MAG: molybdopterin-dependent oxidoreductase [Myxococcota bacterium]